MPLDAVVVTDAWHWDGVHWHAYFRIRPAQGEGESPGDRYRRLEQEPDAVLLSPEAVAAWIDKQIVSHTGAWKVWLIHDRAWTRVGDAHERARLWESNEAIASRGDSIYTDILGENNRYDLFVEAVTSEQCDQQHDPDSTTQHGPA